jgi:hypothetical protein
MAMCPSSFFKGCLHGKFTLFYVASSDFQPTARPTAIPKNSCGFQKMMNILLLKFSGSTQLPPLVV